MMLDTQIVSQMIKSRSRPSDGDRICSTVLKELVGAYKIGDLRRDSFYVPFYSPEIQEIHMRSGIRKDILKRGPQKHHCDKVIVSFGGRFPDLVEYGNRSIAAALNSGNISALKWSIEKLSKFKSRTALSCFDYLIQHGVTCIAATESDFDRAADALFDFSQEYSLKDNFRNSFNDLLILACAERQQEDLQTKDSLLSRFFASRNSNRVSENGSNIVVHFAGSALGRSGGRSESKGYINRGWRIAVENNRL